MASIRHIPIHRAVAATLAAGMLLSILPAATMAGSDAPPAVLATEWDVLQEVNRVRKNHGLAPLRMAADVQEVSRERSRSMKRLGYFGHVSPSGKDAGDLLRYRRIGYRYWGEVIGWTRYMNLTQGAPWMVDWWKHSPVHRDLMLSRNFNYAGVGIAQDGPLTLWTIVFVNRADVTAPVAALLSPTRTARVAGSLRPASVDKLGPNSRVHVSAGKRTTVQWWGRDRRLATRTSGLHSFTVQHKLKGGRWHTVLKGTTARQWSWQLRPGDHAFRIRARDKAGNVGEWQPAAWFVVQ